MIQKIAMQFVCHVKKQYKIIFIRYNKYFIINT